MNAAKALWRRLLVVVVWIVCVAAAAFAVFFGFVAVAFGAANPQGGLGAGIALVIGGAFSLIGVVTACWTGSALAVWYRPLADDPGDEVRYARFARILVWPLFLVTLAWAVFCLRAALAVDTNPEERMIFLVVGSLSCLAALLAAWRLWALHARISRGHR
jgi:hypothetical protein